MSSQQADEKFVEYYHLEHDPFQARVPGFRFFPAQRGSVLNDLHKQARFGSLMQVVTGPLGAGKTLLRQALQASIDKERVATVVLMGRDVASREQLLEGLAGGVGAHSFDEEAVRAQIGLFNQHGQDVYLLVDDAEQLSDESLDVLERVSRIAGESSEGSPQGVRVILFAAPDLLEQLEESGRTEGWQLHPLQPYSLHETRDYLAQRLEGAGQGIELLGDDQVACIHEESAGWPGQINSVARSVMLEGMREDETAPAAAAAGGMRLPRMHMMGLGAVGLLLVLGVLFNTGDLDGSKLGLSQGKEEAPQPQSLQLPLNSGSQSVSRDPVASMAVAPATPPAAAVVPAVPAPVQPVEPVAAASPPSAVVEPARPVVSEPVSKPAPVVASKPVATPAPAPTVKPVVAPVVASKPAPAPAPAPAPIAKPVVAPVVASKPAPAPAAAPAAKPAPAPAPVVASKPVVPAPAPAPVSKPAAPGGSGNGGWYLSQDGNNYTLQLLAVSGEASAQKAVAEGGADYRYFRKEVGGKPMYVVTYGRFTDRNVAMSAVGRLPARFQAGKPVPQSMATIQQYIRQAGQ